MKLYKFLLLMIGSAAFGQTTVEQFISHPVESGLAVSADGKNLAWVMNDVGKRNVMIKVGTEIPKMLTNFQVDDGQELSQLTFSPNGTILLFVRGSGANPSSSPEGVEQAIYFKDINSKSLPAKLVKGSSPVFFKDGVHFLFSSGGQIYESTLDINSAPKLLFTARGTNSGPKLSTDNREVLFTSDRGDHNFIGIYHIDRKSIRWLAPDVGRDSDPVWSPDGKQVAFIRIPGLKDDELNNITGGTKFSILVADVQTLKASVVWQSPADDGGYAQFYPEVPLTWTKTERILFYSEHSGWNHLHSMNPNGSDLHDITPGDGEVESFVLDATQANLYFDGNREDIDRRHIWKTSVTKGSPQLVAGGEGIEMYPLLAGSTLYCFRSTYNASKVLVKVDEVNKGFVPINPVKPALFQSAAFVKPEAVMLKAADGTAVHAQLFIDRSKSGKRPGIVFMHGGPVRQMLLGFHYMDYYINCYAFNQYLASRGYAVISVNFRAGIGYGKNFRRAKAQGPRGASEYQDVVAAGKHLQSLPDVEPTKIGLWGGSYGGYLTAMGLSRNPEIFKVGVDLHGVHDWSFRARTFSPGGGWGITTAEMDLAYKSSPVSDLSKWTGPVLFVHGDDDRNVAFQETTDLVEKLREKNVPLEVLILPDEAHGFLRYESWKRVFEASADFFERKLK